MGYNKSMLTFIMMVVFSAALTSAASMSADWFPFSGGYMQCNDEYQKCTVQFDKSYYLEWDAVKKNRYFPSE
jgi:hypothetical protein